MREDVMAGGESFNMMGTLRAVYDKEAADTEQEYRTATINILH
jgi:hypothetical protein